MFNYQKKLGNWGEKLAGVFLLNRGYQIKATNFCVAGGQIDLIAISPDRALVFFEVKTRSNQNFGPAEESISFQQKSALIYAARIYLSRQTFHYCSWQFDLLSINLNRFGKVPQVKIKHLKNIFAE